MKLNCRHTPYIKFNSKWIKDLHIRTKKYKTLKSKHRGGESFVTLDLAMISLYMEPKAQATKVKLDKLDYIGIKNVSASKGTTE